MIIISLFSTRSNICLNSSQAILKGIADDGGLFVPSIFPQLSIDDLKALLSMNYKDKAVEILSLFLDDFNKEEISEIIKLAYSAEKFNDSRVAPLRVLDANTYVLELFHGPTIAFKDMALQVLPLLMLKSLKKNNVKNKVSILVATSGDTGKAALEGFKDIDQLSCTVFYPKHGVSKLQELQMLTTDGNNTKVIGVYGNFDDTQSGVKAIFNDVNLNDDMLKNGIVLSSANSINFGRLLPQVVYYFTAYLDLVNMGGIKLGDPVNFSVPTGNFGNILAGYYAYKMGLPISKLICASNSNKVLSDFFNTGVYNIKRRFIKTISPSMDILISSNLERLLYEICDRNPELIKKYMENLKNKSSFKIDSMFMNCLKNTFYANFADDNETKQEIKRIFKKTKYILDTHTAVASNVLEKYRKQSCDLTPTIIVATASPYKFPSDVISAILGDRNIHKDDVFKQLDEIESLSKVPIPACIKELKTLPLKHDRTCQKENMPFMLK